MTHYFEKTIVDTKDIYMGYLVNILTPLLYEGFHSIYERAKSLENTYIQATKIDPNVKNPGVLILFQHFLVGVDKLSDNLIDEETKRIRDNSKCSDIFDSLIKAVMKSHIIVLTYTASKQKCKLVSEKLHEKIEPKYFIHKCYVECARLFYDHPTLFWHEFSSSELKDNQRIIYQLVKIGIKNAIRRCLPMKEILETYLNNDYVEESENSEDEYVKVKDLLVRDELKGDDGGIMKIIDTSDSSVSENITKLETNLNDLSSLIFNRNIYDTLDGKSLSSEVKNPVPIVESKVITVESKVITGEPVKVPEPVKIPEPVKVPEDVVKSENEIKIQKSEIVVDDQKIFDDHPFFKQKGKNLKTNILMDAIKVIKPKKDDDKISIVKHSHSMNNDNYFDEMIEN